MAKILMEGWQCERCGHKWVPREQDAPEPRVCPKCKSPYWNRPRQKPKTDGESVELKEKKADEAQKIS